VAAGRPFPYDHGVDAVIFDLFGVLIRPPTPRGRARLRGLAGLAEPSFATLYWRHRPGYDTGELDSAGYWRLIGAEAGRSYRPEQVSALVRADAAMWARPSRLMVGTLLALRAAGVRTAILSNVPGDIWHRLTGQHAWLAAADATTLSFEAGAAKPEPAIYRRCLEQLGVAPQQALFVDDRADNIAAARRLGLRTRRLTPRGQPLLAASLRRCARQRARDRAAAR
jgi:putative hydrolase of the HAD superfamily